MNLSTPRERYLRDANYKRLVDMMVSFITQAQFTPSEMREASILASILYEEREARIRPLPTSTKSVEDLEDAFMILQDWADDVKPNRIEKERGIERRAL